LFFTGISRSGGQAAALVPFSQLTSGAARQSSLVGAVSGAAVDRQHSLNFGMWPRYDVNTDQLADTTRRSRSGISRRLHRTYVATNKDRDVTGADILFPQELHVGRFHHRVSRFDGADEPFGFDHSQCFKRVWHSSLLLILEVKWTALSIECRQ